MSYIIKIGGSLLFDSNGNIKSEKIKNFVKIVKSLPDITGIVCGGGKIARTYITAARDLDVNESYLDLLGIDVSRINARLLIAALGDKSYPVVVKDIEDALKASLSGKIFIAGGFVPGQSTTTVAVEIAESINAKGLFIFTDVDGIYSKNPKKYPDAEKFDKITIEELEKIILEDSGDTQSAAGEYRIFDATSIQIFKRSKLKIRLLNGDKPELLKKIIDEDFDKSKEGTLIIR